MTQNTYKPDGYAIIKLTNKLTSEIEYFVFGSWSGGYLDSDYWRRNSGIVEFKEDEDYYHFFGSTGSSYKCDKLNNHITHYNYNVLNQMIEVTNKDAELKAELLTVGEFKNEFNKTEEK